MKQNIFSVGILQRLSLMKDHAHILWRRTIQVLTGLSFLHKLKMEENNELLKKRKGEGGFDQQDILVDSGLINELSTWDQSP